MASYDAVHASLKTEPNCQRSVESSFTLFFGFLRGMGRLLQRAVKFTSAMPFVNPSRAPPSVVQLQGGRFVNGDIPTQNAVFLTTGIISECALVSPTESSPPSYGVPGAAVRRVKLRPFAVEFERAAAFLGLFLDTKGSDEYLGPIYNNGLAFVTRKEGTNKGRLSLSVSIVCADFLF